MMRRTERDRDRDERRGDRFDRGDRFGDRGDRFDRGDRGGERGNRFDRGDRFDRGGGDRASAPRSAGDETTTATEQ
jgi:hypothetical protein